MARRRSANWSPVRWEPETPEVHDYWTTTYRVESLVCLQALLDLEEVLGTTPYPRFDIGLNRRQ